MTYLSIGLRAILTLAFVAAGGAKLAGAAPMVETFEAIGFGQGFRYFTGIVEIAGAALLWLPNLQVLGGLVLGGTMVGAVLTHWFIIGPSSVPAIVLGLLSAAVVYIHRDQLRTILGRRRTAG